MNSRMYMHSVATGNELLGSEVAGFLYIWGTYEVATSIYMLLMTFEVVGYTMTP